MRKKSRAVRTKAAARKKITRRAPAAEAAPAAAETAALALPAACTTADADSLKLRLDKLVRHPKPVTLDRSAVQRIDTATLQMLAVFVRERRQNGLGIEWSGDAPAFTSAAALLGLTSLL